MVVLLLVDMEVLFDGSVIVLIVPAMLLIESKCDLIFIDQLHCAIGGVGAYMCAG